MTVKREKRFQLRMTGQELHDLDQVALDRGGADRSSVLRDLVAEELARVSGTGDETGTDTDGEIAPAEEVLRIASERARDGNVAAAALLMRHHWREQDRDPDERDDPQAAEPVNRPDEGDPFLKLVEGGASA